MSVRAVFFDLGGTLFSYGSLRSVFGRALAGVAREYALDASPDEVRHAYQVSVMTVLSEYADRPYYRHSDLFAEAHARMLERLGVPAAAHRESPVSAGPTGLGLERVTPRDGVRSVLERLRAADLHLAIVSNIDDDQFEAIWNVLGLADCFDAITTSEAAGSCKPDGRIFEVAVAKAGVAPEAVAFVGDSLHHDVAGANAAGMRSIWLSSAPPEPDSPHVPDHIIRDLRELPELLLR